VVCTTGYQTPLLGSESQEITYTFVPEKKPNPKILRPLLADLRRDPR